MTKQEKIIVSAYTGVLMCDFDDVHEYIQKKLGRPVYTHELADKGIQKEVKEKSHEDFLEICNREEPEPKNNINGVKMSELISKEDALNCFHDWIDRYGYEHTADEDPVYQRIEALDAVRCCDEDCISRRVAIEAIDDIESEVADGFGFQYEKWREYFCELPAVQPDHNADVSKKVSISCGQENDLISRKAAIDALWKAMYEYEDETEKQFLESEELDVGEWIGHRIFVQNMNDIDRQTILNLPSAQPAANCSEFPNSSDDTISRQAAIDALAKQMPRSYTPDGSHPADEEIFRAQEVFVDCIEALEILPPAAPSTAHTTETTAETTAPSTDDWIPCNERLPEENGQYLITIKYKHVNNSYEDIYAEHGEWLDGKWDMFCFGHCGEVEDIIAWMPLPEPTYKEEHGGDK